jgi:hypothetical protein
LTLKQKLAFEVPIWDYQFLQDDDGGRLVIAQACQDEFVVQLDVNNGCKEVKRFSNDKDFFKGFYIISISKKILKTKFHGNFSEIFLQRNSMKTRSVAEQFTSSVKES